MRENIGITDSFPVEHRTFDIDHIAAESKEIFPFTVAAAVIVEPVLGIEVAVMRCHGIPRIDNKNLMSRLDHLGDSQPPVI